MAVGSGRRGKMVAVHPQSRSGQETWEGVGLLIVSHELPALQSLD